MVYGLSLIAGLCVTFPTQKISLSWEILNFSVFLPLRRQSLLNDTDKHIYQNILGQEGFLIVHCSGGFQSIEVWGKTVELLVEEVPHVTSNQEAKSSWIQATSHNPSEPHPCVVFSPGRPHFLRAPLHSQEAACGRRAGAQSTHLWLVFQIN